MKYQPICEGKPVKSLEGRTLASKIFQKVSDTCKKNAVKPGLAVIQVGEDSASTVYVSKKIEACKNLGFHSEGIKLPSDVAKDALKATIEGLNNRSDIHGIIVQIPLPKPLRKREVLQWIDPSKDVDGLHPENMGRLVTRLPLLAPPCTPYGVMALLKQYDIPLQGKQVMVLGRSYIVGMPMVHMLIQANATVLWTHRFSVDHQKLAPKMDVIVTATGKPGLIDATWVGPQTVLVDIGITKIDGKLYGDVDAKSVDGIIAARTPVPGGVGPLTIAILMRNVASLTLKQPIDIF